MGEQTSGRVLGDVGSRLLLENERVRVWELCLDPGEESDLHEHTLDYVMCIIDGQRIDADFESGETLEIPVEPGTVIFVPKGNRETAVNRGKRRFHEILIELKES